MQRAEGARIPITLGLVVAGVMLASYGVVAALGVPLLADDRPSLGVAGAGAAVIGVALLVIDAVVPVPSSGVMIALGALFGVAWGTALGMIGSLGAALFGWWLGERGARLQQRRASPSPIGRRHLVSDATSLAAIIASRPLPVVAETVAVLAGASGVPARRVVAGTAIGALPPALAYASVGAAAGEADVAFVVVVVVMALALAAWLVAARRPGAVRSS